MREHPLALSELVVRLQWFVSLRWLAAIAIALAAMVLWLTGSLSDPTALLFISLILTLINVAYRLWLQGVDGGTISAANAVKYANVQIAVDLILLTLVLHYVGGVENPFFTYFVFHVIIASILLPVVATYMQATLAVLLFGSLVLLEYFAVVPHVTIGALGSRGAYSQVGYVLAVLIAFASTLYLAAYMATSIVGRLRRREDEVIDLKDSLQVEQERLGSAYQQLQEVEAAKAWHMRTVGHELRAPLAAVHTLISTVLSGAAGNVGSEAHDLLERAVERTREMVRMVDDLLVLSRAREVAGAVQREIRVEEIARKVASLFAPMAQAKGVALEATIPAELPPLSGDPVGIEELLTNLLSNAVKYTPAGGKVTLTVYGSDSTLVIEVSDSGIGIGPDELPHIFDEFYRSERARHIEREGTGLGLAVVRAVVEAHHGEIGVESQLGKGTKIVVRLPLSRPADQAKSGASERAIPSPTIKPNGSGGRQ